MKILGVDVFLFLFLKISKYDRIEILLDTLRITWHLAQK